MCAKGDFLRSCAMVFGGMTKSYRAQGALLHRRIGIGLRERELTRRQQRLQDRAVGWVQDGRIDPCWWQPLQSLPFQRLWFAVPVNDGDEATLDHLVAALHRRYLALAGDKPL